MTLLAKLVRAFQRWRIDRRLPRCSACGRRHHLVGRAHFLCLLERERRERKRIRR